MVHEETKNRYNSYMRQPKGALDQGMYNPKKGKKNDEMSVGNVQRKKLTREEERKVAVREKGEKSFEIPKEIYTQKRDKYIKGSE